MTQGYYIRDSQLGEGSRNPSSLGCTIFGWLAAYMPPEQSSYYHARLYLLASFGMKQEKDPFWNVTLLSGVKYYTVMLSPVLAPSIYGNCSLSFHLLLFLPGACLLSRCSWFLWLFQMWYSIHSLSLPCLFHWTSLVFLEILNSDYPKWLLYDSVSSSKIPSWLICFHRQKKK